MFGRRINCTVTNASINNLCSPSDFLLMGSSPIIGIYTVFPSSCRNQPRVTKNTAHRFLALVLSVLSIVATHEAYQTSRDSFYFGLFPGRHS